jgi:hypothetical protein
MWPVVRLELLGAVRFVRTQAAAAVWQKSVHRRALCPQLSGRLTDECICASLEGMADLSHLVGNAVVRASRLFVYTSGRQNLPKPGLDDFIICLITSVNSTLVSLY